MGRKITEENLRQEPETFFSFSDSNWMHGCKYGEEVGRIRSNVRNALEVLKSKGVPVPEDANSNDLVRLILMIGEKKTVRHGHWIKTSRSGCKECAKCSVCGIVYDAYKMGVGDGMGFRIFSEHTHYCPNCGATMDEVDDEG